MQLETALTFDDVLMVPRYSEVLPNDASPATELGGIRLRAPILSAAMDTVTDGALATAMAQSGGLGVLHKNMSRETMVEMIGAVKRAVVGADATRDASGRAAVGVAVGIGDSGFARAEAALNAGADLLVIDTAHGHSAGVIRAVRRCRAAWPHAVIVGGNIATMEAVRALAEAGASGVKVGIGPGSICTTRIVAGVGVPQLLAVSSCADEARNLGLFSIADGGIRTSGDAAKALAAGADAVMVGSLLAGCDEAPGMRDGETKVYRGMGSIDAMRAGSADRYFQDASKKLVAEGVVASVQASGPVAEVVAGLAGGIRSAMGYLGAANLEKMRGRVRFVRITGSGLTESHVHDVTT